MVMHQSAINKFLAISLLSILAILYACENSSPIIVGFSGQLTGKSSDLGVYGRNGATLAVEMINASGGINGRPLKLLAKDDKNTVEGALEADRELIEAGAVAIIGHLTSSQAIGALPQMSQHNIAMVSPTAATSQLSDLKDNFFRIMVENTVQSQELADYARTTLDIRTVVTTADTDNKSFTLTYKDSFVHEFKQLGGTVLEDLVYSGNKPTDWSAIIDTLAKLKPDAVLLTCSAQDAVSIAQRIHSTDLKTTILSASWAYTEKLLQWGGQYVEGMLFAIDYAADNPHPNFIKFREAYKSRFGVTPNFVSAFSYEAVLALAEGLKITNGSPEGLLEAMAPSDTIHGVISDFKLNEFGDVKRDIFIVTIQEGEFRTVEMR